MNFESWSVVKENRGIPMKMGVYSAFMSSESPNYTTSNFNILRYVFDFTTANFWNTYNAWIANDVNPFSGFTYTDASGTHNLSDNPAKAFDGTPNINFNHSNVGRVKFDYYERMGRIGFSNNLQMALYVSDNGRGGNRQLWQSNMTINKQLNGVVASNIYKVEISTFVNGIYKVAPKIYQNFYCINELFDWNNEIKNINEPFPLLRYFGLTGSGANVDKVTIAHMNLATHIFQTTYDNLPAELKSKRCLYTGDWRMGRNYRGYIKKYKEISDRLQRGAQIHGVGMQLGLGQIKNHLLEIETDMLHARSNGFDIGVMEFQAHPDSDPNDMGKLIKICLNQGVKFFNLHDYRSNHRNPRGSKIRFFDDDNTPTEFYTAVLDVFKTYEPLKYNSGERI
jgi:hypothetical protein